MQDTEGLEFAASQPCKILYPGIRGEPAMQDIVGLESEERRPRWESAAKDGCLLFDWRINSILSSDWTMGWARRVINRQ